MIEEKIIESSKKKKKKGEGNHKKICKETSLAKIDDQIEVSFEKRKMEEDPSSSTQMLHMPRKKKKVARQSKLIVMESLDVEESIEPITITAVVEPSATTLVVDPPTTIEGAGPTIPKRDEDLLTPRTFWNPPNITKKLLKGETIPIFFLKKVPKIKRGANRIRKEDVSTR